MQEFIKLLFTILLGINILLDIRVYIILILFDSEYIISRESLYNNSIIHVISWAIIYLLWS